MHCTKLRRDDFNLTAAWPSRDTKEAPRAVHRHRAARPHARRRGLHVSEGTMAEDQRGFGSIAHADPADDAQQRPLISSGWRSTYALSRPRRISCGSPWTQRCRARCEGLAQHRPLPRERLGRARGHVRREASPSVFRRPPVPRQPVSQAAGSDPGWQN
ncbi:hypothetical protein PsYK624_073750 [Phanerochaete sordida]|uniref:Uncharacterized protein n=1 Tax=Phanerochaete sordida TaxID=48140 RepID=A0A9P3LD69_9APHY|nr:hypothetical protein PsYK624_073750 [Phanerochaete sordida]